MMERWYYTHDGQRLGPVSADDLDRLTAEGRLLPTDLLWRVGADVSTAVEAGTVLIALAQTTGYVPNRTPAPPVSKQASTTVAFGMAPAPSVPMLPDWLGDVKAAEAGQHAHPAAWQPSVPENSGTEQPPAPCPDWLQDMQSGQEATAPAEPATKPETKEPTGPIPTAPVPPGPERVKERMRASPSSVEALLQNARHELEAWVNAPANQALIMQGEVRVILGERSVQALLARYRSHGAAMQERLRSLLRSLIESRRKGLANTEGPNTNS